MKTLLVTALLFVAASAQNFDYCTESHHIFTLWPYWDDFTKFVQCTPALRQYTIHTCQAPLLFNYFWQV